MNTDGGQNDQDLRAILRDLTVVSARHRYALGEEGGRAVVLVQEKETGRIVRRVPPERLLRIHWRLDRSFSGFGHEAA